MIKKLLFYLFVFFLVFPSFAQAKTPAPSPSPEPIDSFTLFWPIVAGTVRGEALYPLKQLKETIREFLIFSDYRKADYNITLSVKRVVEAEKLFVQLKDYKNAAASLEEAQRKRERALMFIEKAQAGGKVVTDLKNTLAAILEKQKKVLFSLETVVPEAERGSISQDLTKIDALLSKLQ